MLPLFHSPVESLRPADGVRRDLTSADIATYYRFTGTHVNHAVVVDVVPKPRARERQCLISGQLSRAQSHLGSEGESAHAART